jgi:hypothetical protein
MRKLTAETHDFKSPSSESNGAVFSAVSVILATIAIFATKEVAEVRADMKENMGDSMYEQIFKEARPANRAITDTGILEINQSFKVLNQR